MRYALALGIALLAAISSAFADPRQQPDTWTLLCDTPAWCGSQPAGTLAFRGTNPVVVVTCADRTVLVATSAVNASGTQEFLRSVPKAIRFESGSDELVCRWWTPKRAFKIGGG
ncbi:MAG: hypothetical protein RI911_515 [Candidatus Parcubacteria bacterium]|jgi:hypothetical protein